MTGSVLLIEDDKDISARIVARLALGGYSTSVIHDGADGLAEATSGTAFDAIVLDRRLPTTDGMTILRSLRSQEVRTPVLMLTALDRVEDRVEGLKGGADDYLVKPFAFDELEARLGALIRRSHSDQSVSQICVGDLVIDLMRRHVTRAGVSVLLQPREFRLLEVLARNAGATVSRMMLLEQVWNYRFDPRTKVLETHVSRLRSKLNEGGRPDLIETVRSVGYRLMAA